MIFIRNKAPTQKSYVELKNKQKIFLKGSFEEYIQTQISSNGDNILISKVLWITWLIITTIHAKIFAQI